MSATSAREKLLNKMKSVCYNVEDVNDLPISFFNEDLLHISHADLNWILKCAVWQELFRIVRYFVRAEIKIGRLDESTETAIHFAGDIFMSVEEQEVVRMLFNIYDHFNYTDEKGLSHFHMACLIGDVDVIQRFIDQGVDVNQNKIEPFGDKFIVKTPLYFTSYSRQIDAVIMLLSNGADPNVKMNQDLTLLNSICLRIPLFTEENFFHLSTIQRLLQYKSNVNIKDEDGCSPIMNLFLCEPDVSESQKEALKLFLQYNADVTHVNNKGETVLHLVLRWEKTDAHFNVKEFQKSDADINEVVEMLLKHGANVNIQDHDGNTPLNVAVSYCNYDAVKILLEHDALIETVNFKGGLLEPSSEICKMTLRNLEMTQNLLAIIELLKSKGFLINNHQKLNVMQFFNGFDETYEVIHPYNQIASGYVTTIDRCINGKKFFYIDENQVYYSIRKYLDIIKIGKIYLDPGMRNYLQEKLQIINTIYKYKNDMNKYEIFFDKAKKTMINSTLSLHDLCSLNLRKTYRLLDHCDYSSVVNSEDFEKKFGDINRIFKGHILQSLIRGFFEKVAREANLVRLLTQMYLPDLCCEIILENLDNNTILSIYKQYVHELQTEKC